MAVFNSLAKVLAKPIPRVMNPRAHSIVDYVSVGVFLGSAAWFWSRNRRAAMASLICGGAELALILATDYPGGISDLISFRTHREMDYGLAAMTAAMPESMSFDEDAERKFFRLQGALITLLGEITETSSASAGRSGRYRAA